MAHINASTLRRGAPAILLFLCGLMLPPEIASQPKPIRRVLILNEVGPAYPLIKLTDEGIQAGLAQSPYQIQFYREYMDSITFPDAADQQLIRDFIARKYANRKPDAIITVGSSPLKYMTETHRTLFPGVPIVFCFPSVLTDSAPQLDPDFTGVRGDISPAATVQAALRLLPNTEHIAVVGGTSWFDRQQQAVVHQELKRFEQRLDVTYLADLTVPAILDRLSHLPSHSIVLLASVGKDAAGATYTSAELGPMIVGASNSPVFSMSDRHLNHGEVGGDVSSALQQGKLVAGLVTRLLNGEKDIPVINDSSRFVFDSAALYRWGLKERDLPPGSTIINRKPGLWEQYRKYSVAMLCVFLLQLAIIVCLLWQRARRMKTEAELRRSEEKFSKSFRHSPLAIAIVSTKDSTCIDVNESFEEQTGWKRDELIGHNALETGLWLNIDQGSSLLAELLNKGELRDAEIPFRRRDGQFRTALGSADLIEVNAEPCALCVFADITDRKLAEEALSKMSGKLIEAQEEERARIARELHDDINQQVAVIAVKLKSAKQDLSIGDVKAIHRIEDACSNIAELGKNIQALSHRLHSSRLEYLGLEAAASAFCRELSEQQSVEVAFSAEGIPDDLSQNIALCLYRVLQESLHNAVKHSGSNAFKVKLEATDSEILMSVSDSGTGFDPKAVRNGHGLGLTSMTERLRLVNGQLSVQAGSLQGTTVFARVPLAPVPVVGESV